MAKQTLKQEMMQQIANSQVQQVMQERQAAQLQANFAAWQKEQDDIAQLQASFAAWQKENAQPVQQPVQEIAPVKAQQTIPSLGSYKDEAKDRALARRQRLSQLTKSNKENQKQREDYQRQQQIENMLVSQKPEDNRTANQVIQDAIRNEKQEEKKDNVKALFGKTASSKQNDIKTMLTEQPEVKPSTTISPEQSSNSQFDEVAKIVENAAKDWAPRFTYRGSKWENPYDSMTPEQQQIVRDYVQQNKNNPNLSEDERKRLGDFLKVYGGSGDVEDYNDIATAYNNTFSDRMQTLRAGIGGFVNANKPVVDLMAKGASKLPIMGQAIDLDEAEKAYDASVTNAMDKNRAAAEIGRGAGQIYDYLVTSPVVGAATSAMGLKGLAAAAVNQGAQATQDLALDIIPEAQRMLKEEGKINWGELAKRFGTDVVMNVAMELIPSLRGVNYDYLTKTVGNNADIFKNMTQSGAYKTIPDIANSIANAASDIKVNEAPVENVAKMPMIPGMETERAVVDDINRQFSDLMGSYHPETSAMRNIYNADDLSNSLNEQLANALKRQSDEVANVAKLSDPNDLIKNSLDNVNTSVYDDGVNNVNSILRGNDYGTDISKGYDRTTGEGILRTDSTERSLGSRISTNGVSGGKYLPADRVSVSDNVTKYPKVFDDADAQKLTQSNIPYNDYYDVQEPDMFSKALETAKANNPHGGAVDSHTSEEIQEILNNGGRTFLTADGTAGGAVDNGNLTAVFKDNLNNDTPRAASSIAIAGVKNGAIKGDCFGQFLVNSYSKAGFEPVARMKYAYGFNELMDKQVKDQLAQGLIKSEPDVYVLKLKDGYDYQKAIDGYKTAKKWTQQELDSLPLYEDYDEMLKYRDSLIKEQPKQDAFFDGRNSSSIDLMEKGSGEDKISKYRTNSMNKLESVNEQNAPISDYGYKNFSTEEQTIEGDRRWGSNPNATKDLLGKENWDEVDARYAQRKWTELMEAGEVEQANRMARRMSYELREGGRLVQTAAEMDDIASQLNEARRMINSRVDKIGGVGTSEALDNFATKAESRLDNIDLSTNEGKEKAANIMAEMMSKDMKTYAPSNKAMTSKQFKKANRIIEDIRSGKLKTTEDIINEVYKKNGSVPIEAENQKKIYDLLNSAKDLEDGSREQEIVLARAARLATKNVPTTFGEKVRGVLYMNMLGNFKTAISRNAFGNLGYQVLEQARSPLAAGVDWLTSKATGKHSELGWNKEKFKAYGRGLKKGAKEQAGDFVSGLNTGRSGSLGWAEALKNNKSTFNYRGDPKVLQGLSDIANKAEFYVENAMKFGDRPFFEANYQQRKTEIYQLLNRYGKENVAGFSAIPDSELEDTIDMVASVHAADSVFQKQGKISKGLTDLRNGLGKVSEGTIGVDLLSTAASPFTLTPGNMLEKAVEYSPLGAVKNVVETAKELRQGKFNQRRFVDEASRTLTGLPILAATYGLAKKGVINGGYSDDYDEKAAQQEDGFIEYGLNLPNGRTYDTSDIPVVGPFMQAGAAVAEDGVNAKSLLQGASAITAGSTMQGLRRAFGADNGFGSTSSVENLIDTIKSSGTQLVPSLLRQTAQTTDAYKRDLGEYGTNEYYLNAIKNSVPGFRQTLPVKTDVEGKPILQNQGRNIGSKILENYLLPMNVSEYNPSPLNAEASRLLDTTDSSIAFVPKAKRSDLRDWDEKAGMEYSEEQFRTYKEELGKLNSELGNALIQSDFYANLDDKDKAKKLQAVYSAMKAVAKKNTTGIDTDDTIANAYINSDGNIESVINHIQGKDIVKGSGLSTSNKAAKQAQELANNGDIEGAQEVIDQKLSMNEALEAHGYDKNSETYQRIYNDYGGEAGLNDLDTLGSVSAFYSYQEAKDEAKSLKTMKIPSIEDYAKTYSKIDRYGNKNGSVTQKEMASYLNAGNYTLEQATDLAILYGDWDKAPHIIKSGKNKGKWGF